MISLTEVSCPVLLKKPMREVRRDQRYYPEWYIRLNLRTGSAACVCRNDINIQLLTFLNSWLFVNHHIYTTKAPYFTLNEIFRFFYLICLGACTSATCSDNFHFPFFVTSAGDARTSKLSIIWCVLFLQWPITFYKSYNAFLNILPCSLFGKDNVGHLEKFLTLDPWSQVSLRWDCRCHVSFLSWPWANI